MSQNFSYCPSEMQFTTWAVTLRSTDTGKPFNWTEVPIFRGRPNRTAQPCGFARIMRAGSEKESVASRLVRVTEM
jgi:hypothetical protein